MSDLRVGFRGCGLVALGAHCRNSGRIPGIAFTAAYDPDPRRLARAAELVPGLRTFDDERRFLEGPIDAAIVAVPYEEHAEATRAAFAAGKHVYIEKPFAYSIEHAVEMHEAWRGAGRVGMVGFNYRFNPLFTALRHQLRSGRIGTLTGIRTSFSFRPHGGVDWDITRHGHWGALFDPGPHHYDLIRYLTGEEVGSVFAASHSARADKDSAQLQLVLRNGLPVQCTLSLSSVAEHRVEAYGTEGKLAVDTLRGATVEFTAPEIGRFGSISANLAGLGRQLTHTAYLRAKLREPWNEPSFRTAMTAFARAAAGEPGDYPDFDDGLASQRIVEAAAQSAETAASVRVIS